MSSGDTRASRRLVGQLELGDEMGKRPYTNKLIDTVGRCLFFGRPKRIHFVYREREIVKNNGVALALIAGRVRNFNAESARRHVARVTARYAGSGFELGFFAGCRSRGSRCFYYACFARGLRQR